jgi:hypothetical protein
MVSSSSSTSVEESYPASRTPSPLRDAHEEIRVYSPPVDATDDLPRFCGLQAMEAGWISVPVGGGGEGGYVPLVLRF